jgi:tRNA(Ile)-lysidine synthetase-like protein
MSFLFFYRMCMYLARRLSYCISSDVIRRRVSLAGLLLSLLLLSGCGTVGYYYQSIHGHFSLLGDSRPISEILQDKNIDPELRRKLELILQLRRFATEHLELPQNDSYRSYAFIDRKAVVWSVVATPEFSVSPKQWCYPVVGCASYRGYFDLHKAQSYADKLSGEGLDVTVDPVAAYSTLGWFDDPLPSTVINWPESQLEGLIFHELAHQLLYVAGDSEFNEAFASSVEQVGVERWLRSRQEATGLKRWLQYKRRKQEFYRILLESRERLEKLYARPLPDEEMRTRKAAEFDRLHSNYLQLKRQWHGYAGFDHWFRRDLNNARLASVATYARQMPAFLRLLHRSGGDLERFYQACKQLADLPATERTSRMGQLLQE